MDRNYTLGKKTLKSVAISRNKITFKNWNLRIFHKQEGYFLKIAFFLISVMVSTSKNESCKILFCLGEIVLFYSEYSSGNHYWNYVEANVFKEKRHCFY